MRQAIAVLPNDWKIHFDLAELFEKLGQMNEALKEYQAAVDWFYDEVLHLKKFILHLNVATENFNNFIYRLLITQRL